MSMAHHMVADVYLCYFVPADASSDTERRTVHCITCSLASSLVPPRPDTTMMRASGNAPRTGSSSPTQEHSLRSDALQIQSRQVYSNRLFLEQPVLLIFHTPKYVLDLLWRYFHLASKTSMMQTETKSFQQVGGWEVPPIMPGLRTSSSSSLPSDSRFAPWRSMKPYASINTIVPGRVMELHHPRIFTQTGVLHNFIKIGRKRYFNYTRLFLRALENRLNALMARSCLVACW